MKDRKNKDQVLSIRATDEELAPLEELRKKAGINKSRFYSQVLLSKNPVFKEASQHFLRMLFLYNKSSNNLNQLAHQVNSSHRRGLVSDSVYAKWLNTLISIESLLLAGISNAD